MNPQEKKLMIVVAVLGATLGLWQGYRAYQGKLADLDNEKARQLDNLKRVEAERAEAERGEIEWKAIGQQTLSLDPNEATTRMRDELNELTAKSRLSGSTVRILPVRAYGRTGVSVLESKVSAEGSLNEILAFLFEIHRQPYLIRCKDIVLGLARSDSRARGDQSGIERMTLQVSIETLILPTNRRVPASEIVTADLQRQNRQPQERLMLARVADYRKSIRPALFEPYKEPPPPPPPPGPRGREDRPRPAPRQPPPPPPPPDEDMVVGRILIWPGNEQVVLEKSGRGQQEDKRVEIGDTVYGGTLIYIHPKGAVTEQKDGKWLFHPVSSPLKDNFELTADSQPEVYYKLTKLQEWLKGITIVPG